MRPETEAFSAHLRDRRSPRTVRTYADVLDDFQSFLTRSGSSGTEPIARSIEVFLSRPRKDGGRRSAATRNQELAALRAYSAFARREGIWRTDPTDGVPFVREPPHDPPVLSVFELRRLFFVASEIANGMRRARALAVLALLSQLGLRVHELVALDLDQVDAQSATLLSVRGKGGTIHDLPLNAPTAALVLAWLAIRNRISVENEKALFVSSRGTRLSIRSVEHLISDLRIRMGTAKRLTPHTLRHSAATLALTMGVDVSTVGELLRHQDLNTTRRYLHLVDARRRDAVQKLAIAIPPALVPAQSLEDGAIPRASEPDENRLDDQCGLDEVGGIDWERNQRLA